jgi:hypothetical protein
VSGRAAAREVRPQAEAVLETLLGCAAWEPFHGPTGALLWRLPGSDGAVYTVALTSCTCLWERYGHGTRCKHQAALDAFLTIARAIKRHRRGSAPPQPPRETADRVD